MPFYGHAKLGLAVAWQHIYTTVFLYFISALHSIFVGNPPQNTYIYSIQ